MTSAGTYLIRFLVTVRDRCVVVVTLAIALQFRLTYTQLAVYS